MSAGPARLPELDLLKTMLVVGMVATHVIQLVSLGLPGWTGHFAEFINLVTFSGFLFAMGMGLGLSRGGQRPLRHRLRPILLLLLATYISSFAFALLVDRQPLTGDLVVNVLTMRRLFGWSEFLATFFVLYVLVALARTWLVAVAANPLLLVLATAFCLATTFVVMDQNWPLIATLIGTTRFASFPLLPYLPWFLVGIAIARNAGRVTPWHWLVAIAASGLLVWVLVSGGVPERFPPSIEWIMGPALPLLIYFVIAKAVAGNVALPGWATVPGRHVLSYLLVSNLLIFTLRNLEGRPVRDVGSWLALAAAIIALIGIGWLVREGWRRRNMSRPPAAGLAGGRTVPRITSWLFRQLP